MEPSIDLMGLMDAYGSEDQCREVLAELRWPTGPICPKCSGLSISRIYDRGMFECNDESCRYQFSVTSGTVLHDTHLPLRKWFVAAYLMTESKKGVSALQLKRVLGIGSYRTAWHLCHRIRSAMLEAQPAPLSGVVEADETFVGGKAKNMHKNVRIERITGRGPKDKTAVIGAIERGGKVRLRVVPNRRRQHVEGFLGHVVADSAKAIYSDELRSYDRVGDADTAHETVNHSAEEWVRGQVHTNSMESVWSLLDRAIMGSYHHLSVKHLPNYLQEFEWRFNNRENPYLFRDTLARLVNGDVLTYRTLISA